MSNVVRPTWVEIDLDILEENVAAIRRHLDEHGARNAGIMAVVKAEGYGHGMLPVAAAALRSGASCLGVAIVEEAFELRQAGFEEPILVLGWTPPAFYPKAVEANLELTVFSLGEVKQLARVARNCGRAVNVHVKVDTGMTRLGVPSNSRGLAKVVEMAEFPEVRMAGLFTHFAAADEDPVFTRKQARRFFSFRLALRRFGLDIPYHHLSNSAAILEYPEYAGDLVRPGLILYGAYPSDRVRRTVVVRPFLRWKTTISQIKWVPPGTPIGYGMTFVTDRAARIATLPVGYADGYPRLLSNQGEVLIRGQRYPIVGRVCMDQVMVMLPEERGDWCSGEEVTLLGSSGDNVITVDDLAREAETIPHEIFTQIGSRVPRVLRRFDQE